MDQKKIGAFLKQLRNEKGLTQEELSEKFYVSSKTVSRWETGSNMPDLSILIELSEFYEIDIRELIDGERRKTPLENDTNDALKKAAEYSKEERKNDRKKLLKYILITLIALVSYSIPLILFHGETTGLLYHVVPNNIRHIIVWILFIFASIPSTYVYISFLSFMKKSYFQKGEDKKHCIINSIFGLIFLLSCMLSGFLDKTYGFAYNFANAYTFNIIKYFCFATIFIHTSYFIAVFAKFIKNLKQK